MTKDIVMTGMTNNRPAKMMIGPPPMTQRQNGRSHNVSETVPAETPVQPVERAALTPPAAGANGRPCG